MTEKRETSKKEKAQTRRYLWEAVPSLSLAIVPVVVIASFGAKDLGGIGLTLLIVLAIVGAASFVVVMIRHVMRADEYQRRGIVSALALGFAATMVAAFTTGLLEIAGQEVRASGWIVLAAGMTAWLLAGLVGERR